MRRGIRMRYVKVTTKPSGLRFIYYVRPGYERARLPDLPENDPAFLAAYAQAAAGAVRAPSRLEPVEEGTIAALCASYRRSLAFRGLRASTRKMRAPIVGKIAEKVGAALVTDLAPRHIRQDIAELSPHAANNRLKVWRVLLNHAVEVDLIEISPAVSVKPHKLPAGGFHCWTDAEVQQYRAHHASGTKARLALEVALWTGARLGDLVRLGRQNITRGSLSYVSEKTRIEVCIPVLPEAQAELGHVPKTRMLFFETPSSDAFGQWFRSQCRAAGLRGCSMHGLRKARARIIAENGESAHAIMAWGGWETLAEVQHYTKAVDRRKLTHAGTELKRKLDNPSNPVVENREKANGNNAGE